MNTTLNGERGAGSAEKTAIAEHPMLFSGAMVRAILRSAERGTGNAERLQPKTQTRRVMKPQPSESFTPSKCEMYAPIVVDKDGDQQPGPEVFGCYDMLGQNEGYKCPYGKPGERIWVKETHIPKPSGTLYRADLDSVEAAGIGAMYGGWKPSIFMRRKYSRITLEIVSVRVERLQDISEEDALAEGIDPVIQMGTHRTWTNYAPGLPAHTDAINSYKSLWESINGQGSWDLNPWVWVIEFKKL